MLRTSVLALLCALMMPAAARGAVETVERETRHDLVTAAAYDHHETIRQCLWAALYWEGGSTGEPEKGLRKKVRVILGRTMDNVRQWGGNSLCGVVYYAFNGLCQFTFACKKKGIGRPPDNNEYARLALRVADEEIDTRFSHERARYYFNPKLTSRRVQCRFKREFLFDEVAGRHEFYRPPESEEEKLALARSNPPECQNAKAAEARAKHSKSSYSGKKKSRFAKK